MHWPMQDSMYGWEMLVEMSILEHIQLTIQMGKRRNEKNSGHFRGMKLVTFLNKLKKMMKNRHRIGSLLISGVIDIPAMIDYILAKTKNQKLHYIGHSQVLSSFFSSKNLYFNSI